MSRIVIVGGGAAGFFAAIACAEACSAGHTGAEVVLLESGRQFLSKVRISGGGRCNVTHACADPRTLAASYPRGGRTLIAAFSRFQPSDTVAWFAARGVKLKAENDGRMFPVTDSSETIVDCLVCEARSAGVILKTDLGVESVERRPKGGFSLALSNGETLACDRLLLATGGCRTTRGSGLAASLGHAVEAPVPSLFTFHIDEPWLRHLAGISVGMVEASIPGTKLRERGALLATHSGASGPVILRLSAWGARLLHERDYKFPLHIHWLPHMSAEAVASELKAQSEANPSAFVLKTPLRPLPARLWEALVISAGIPPETRWAAFPRASLHRLAVRLTRTEFHVTGKNSNKAEFVTCGGVRLSEVNFKTMESRVSPGLYFAGELLDIDGLTGGYNFQAAWTTGWIAGRAMAGLSHCHCHTSR